jgi:putative exporter of polyketide antibiotics
MKTMLTEIALLALGISQFIFLIWVALQRRRIKLMVGELLKLSKMLVEINKKQAKLNGQQEAINSQLLSNIEILAVHAKLVEPSIGLQAEAFLHNENKKKEEDGTL